MQVRLAMGLFALLEGGLHGSEESPPGDGIGDETPPVRATPRFLAEPSVFRRSLKWKVWKQVSCTTLGMNEYLDTYIYISDSHLI